MIVYISIVETNKIWFNNIICVVPAVRERFSIYGRKTKKN
jgi:hypothetical protein